MAVGPQSPPGSPPRPRQVIIPAGAVDETETTVLDVPAGSPLEQPQRIIIPPGTVHPDETTVVVVPAPRIMGSPQRLDEERRAAAEAQARAQAEAETERVRQAKLAFAEYLRDRTDPQATALRHKLLREVDPQYEFEHAHVFAPPLNSRFSSAEAHRVEQDLWGVDLDDIPDTDVDTSGYRLHMSMNLEQQVPHSPGRPSAHGYDPSPFSPAPGYPSRGLQHQYDQALEDAGLLSDIEAPESLYGEDAGWEPPPPPPPLIPPPEEPLLWSPPRYVYQRHAPHDPEDLMWEWEEPPRPVYEIPVLPEPEPYSAELFRLVRL